MLMLMPGLASAHGVVGNRIFLSPIVGNDAFPDNAFTVGTRRSDYQFSLLPSFEKQLSDSSSLLSVSGWDRITPGHGQNETSGSTDLSIYFRQAAYVSVPHELELTLSPILVLPTGNRQIADQGYTRLGGEILLGKGLGDLPDYPSLKYLRPFAVQAEARYTGRIQRPANSVVFANFEVEYSLEYLDHFVERINLDRPLVELVPYVQLNYAQSLIASRLTTSPDFRLTPGVAYFRIWSNLAGDLSSATRCTPSVPLRAAVEQVVRVAFERFAEIRMSDRQHAPRAFLERLSAQFGCAELGHNDIGVATRGRNRATHA
jgi:hypothetical protein